jgi:hypothetical protein
MLSVLSRTITLPALNYQGPRVRPQHLAPTMFAMKTILTMAPKNTQSNSTPTELTKAVYADNTKSPMVTFATQDQETQVKTTQLIPNELATKIHSHLVAKN